MPVNELQGNGVRRAGYAALVERFGLDVIPNWHESYVASAGTHRVESADDVVRETYTSRYWPGEGLGDHLEFAWKYDGVNLATLASIFRAAGAEEITSYVKSKPTGKYARRIWYLYEMLIGDRLPLEDIKRGNYVDLLEPDKYVTASLTRTVMAIRHLNDDGEVVKEERYAMRPTWQVRRQRINDNLLGDARFCPMVRRTEAVDRLLKADLKDRCRQVVSDYPPELLRRALSYLYTKETKSSFEIAPSGSSPCFNWPSRRVSARSGG